MTSKKSNTNKWIMYILTITIGSSIYLYNENLSLTSKYASLQYEQLASYKDYDKLQDENSMLKEELNVYKVTEKQLRNLGDTPRQSRTIINHHIDNITQ